MTQGSKKNYGRDRHPAAGTTGGSSIDSPTFFNSATRPGATGRSASWEFGSRDGPGSEPGHDQTGQQEPGKEREGDCGQPARTTEATRDPANPDSSGRHSSA